LQFLARHCFLRLQKWAGDLVAPNSRRLVSRGVTYYAQARFDRFFGSSSLSPAHSFVIPVIPHVQLLHLESVILRASHEVHFFEAFFMNQYEVAHMITVQYCSSLTS